MKFQYPIALALAAGSAAAQETPWYLTAMVGTVTQSGQTLGYDGPGGSASGPARYGPGLLTGAAIGRSFGPWRAELEFSYQSTEFDRAPFAAPGPAGQGNHAMTAFAVNLLYDFDLGGSPRVRSWAGVGLSLPTEIDVDFEGPAGEQGFSARGGQALQLMLGARYDLDRRWFVDAGLRYRLGSSLTMKGEDGTPGTVQGRFRPWGLTAAIGWRF